MAINNILACAKGKFPDLDESEAKRLLEDFEGIARDEMIAKGGTFEDAMKNAANRAKFEARLNNLRRKHDALVNAERDVAMGARRQELVAQGMSDRDAVNAIYGGTVKNIENGKFSVDAQIKNSVNRYAEKLFKTLEREDLLRLAQQPDMEVHIAKALHVKNGGKNASLDGVPVEAQRAADVIKRVQDELRVRKNKAGAYIKHLDGYVAEQSHNRLLMKKAGLSKWIQDIHDKLDWDRMNVDPSGRMAYLEGAYKQLIDGQHEAFNGANLARRLSEHRDLHFKTPTDWIEYNKAYGSGSLWNTVGFGLKRSARDLVVLQNFGTNPHAFHKRFTADLPKDENIITRSDSLFAELIGDTSIPTNPTLATVGTVYRTKNIVGRLGAALFSYVNDTPVKIAALNRAGMPFFEAFGKTMGDNFASIKDNGVRQAVADSYAIGMEGIHWSIYSDLFSADSVPGVASKLNAAFFKLNLQDWWTNKHKVGAALGLTSLHARYSGKSFKRLPAEIQTTFRHYGIKEKDWDIIRKGVADVEGNKFIRRELIGDEDIAERYATMITDRVDSAVITAGVSERSMVNRGLRRGTIEGEFLRGIMQFKTFPVTFMRRVWGEALNDPNKGFTAQAVTLVMTTMGMAYLSDMARQAAKGRSAPEISEKYVADIFVRSGAGALYADLVLAPILYGGREKVAGIFGPLGTDLKDIFKVMDGEGKTLRELISVTQKNIPGNNLFYVKPVLDYMLFNSMKEFADPGFGGRMIGYGRKDGIEYFDNPLNIARPDRELVEDVQ